MLAATAAGICKAFLRCCFSKLTLLYMKRLLACNKALASHALTEFLFKSRWAVATVTEPELYRLHALLDHNRSLTCQ